MKGGKEPAMHTSAGKAFQGNSKRQEQISVSEEQKDGHCRWSRVYGWEEGQAKRWSGGQRP